MFRSDTRPLRPAGPTELPPYYAQRLQAVEPPGVRSARHAAAGSPEAEAERLFRDFKLGLLTLVIISLLLLAYFWDGGDEGQRASGGPDDVLECTGVLEKPRTDRGFGGFPAGLIDVV